MTTVFPVILCGGSGTRLWPLSRSGFPKQFLSLSGDKDNKTLFQEVVARLNRIHVDSVVLGETIIVTNEDHRFLVLDQLREMDGLQATLLLEPAGRNTAPALTMASLYVKEAITKVEIIDPILIVTPADHTVQNADAFTQALQNCIATVEGDPSNQTIAILGITPTGPETGYGYISKVNKKGSFGEFAVEQFVEKHNLETAATYLEDGNYF
jgi:mannose-1-phosphate guanylyltransferase/mannose-6-phosphate isomerase